MFTRLHMRNWIRSKPWFDTFEEFLKSFRASLALWATFIFLFLKHSYCSLRYNSGGDAAVNFKRIIIGYKSLTFWFCCWWCKLRCRDGGVFTLYKALIIQQKEIIAHNTIYVCGLPASADAWTKNWIYDEMQINKTYFFNAQTSDQ